jgi:hypothetical protein
MVRLTAERKSSFFPFISGMGIGAVTLIPLISREILRLERDVKSLSCVSFDGGEHIYI